MPLRLLIYALMLVFGAWWCKEILGRLGTDVQEIKQPDNARRAVIVGMWLVTVVIMLLMVQFAWGLVQPIIESFSHR